jgi:hypothetical protein
MTEVLIRLWVGLTIRLVAAVVRGVLLVVRLGLWLLGRVGFRGARLIGLAATLAGVGWAAATVGVGPAVRLALVGWAAWATRHHRAAIRQHAAVRRLAAVQQAAVRRLTAALAQHAAALDAATQPSPTRLAATPATGTASKDRDVLASPPWQAAEQPSAAQGIAALGRYAAAWARRHTAPAPEEPR